jgi:hypothetical protein
VVAVALGGCGRIAFAVQDGGETSDAASDIDGADTGSGDGLDTDPALLVWWRLDDDPALGAIDSSGNDRNATCTGCAMQVAGRVGSGAYRFTATHFYVLAHDAAFVTNEGFTIALWMRLDGTSTYTALSKTYGSTTADTWGLGTINLNRPGFCTSPDSISTECAASATTVPVDQWMHIAGTWNAATGEKRLYLDGGVNMTGTGVTVFDTNPIVLGCEIEDGGINRYLFRGSIDDVRVYGRPLTDTEVAALAAR